MAVQLHVTLIEARGLARAQLFGTQDPYCILTLGHRSERTEYHDNGGAEPFWNAPFVFSFKTPTEKAVLDIDIRNANAAFLPDNSIGFVSLRVDLAQWRDRELRQEWLPVYRKQAKARAPNGAKHDGGELKVRMEVLYDTTLASQPSVVVLTKQVAKPMVVTPPKSPVAASPTSRPMTPSHVAPPPSPSKAVPSSPSHSDYRQHECLQPFGGYWIPPERWTLDKSHTAHALLVGNVGKEPVLLQLALSVVDVTSILSTYATLPMDHMLLRLRGFSLHDHAWCVLYEHAAPLTHLAAEPWSRSTTAVAMDVASAMAQLHLAKVIHGGIRLTAVFKDDNDRYRLHGFPSTRPSTGAAVDLPWAAPETLSDEALTRKTDVYAFGIFLAELGLGEAAPFAVHKREARQAFLEAVLAQTYTLEAELTDVVPAPMLSVILKCTTPLITKRPTGLVVVDLVRGAKAALFPGAHTTTM